MDLAIVGSVALDNVRTPRGEVQNALGGSAVYSSLAASYFARPGIVAVVGGDFEAKHLQRLKESGVDLQGLEQVEGKTFHWRGYYEGDMAQAHTLETQLNVFADFCPRIPAGYQNAQFVFLANMDPVLQRNVLEQIHRPRFTLLDTMNFWISQKKADLLEVIRRVDMVVLNLEEARQLSGLDSTLSAARWIQSQGTRGVVIKKGEHGALVLWEDAWSAVPAFPVTGLQDPTGAGDTFAGGLIGSLAAQRDLTVQAMRRAAAVATVLASFTVEAFSVDGLVSLDQGKIRERYDRLKELASFPDAAF